MRDKTNDSEFRRGWPVILASLIGIGLGLSPLPFYTAGVFAPHLQTAFGWSTAQIMAGLSITTLAVVVAAPAAGLLAERYGTRQSCLLNGYRQLSRSSDWFNLPSLIGQIRCRF